jgi:uncharacterized membrane protein YbhN (UPF0104 family)
VKAPRLFLSLGISLSALWWVIHQIDVERFSITLQHVTYFWLAFGCANLLGAMIWRAWRWQLLLRRTKQISFGDALRYTFLGYALNDLLPLRMGDMFRPFIVNRREAAPFVAVLATVVAERMLDAILLAILAAMVMVIKPELFPFIPYCISEWLWLLLLVIMLLTIGIVIGRAKICGRLSGKIPRSLRMGFQLPSDLPTLLSVIGMSAAAWLCELMLYIAVGNSLSLSLAFGDYLMLLVVLNLGTIIPSTPGYVGTMEALGILAWDRILDPSVIGAYMLMLHGVLWVPIVVIGILIGLSFARELSGLYKVVDKLKSLRGSYFVGQSLVEVSLVLPLLVATIFGFISLSRYFMLRNVAMDAGYFLAKEALIVAESGGYTSWPAQLQNDAQDILSPWVGTENVHLTISTDSPSSTCYPNLVTVHLWITPTYMVPVPPQWGQIDITTVVVCKS